MRIALALVASVIAAPAFADDGPPVVPPSPTDTTLPPGPTEGAPPRETPPSPVPATQSSDTDGPSEPPTNEMLVPAPRRPVADIVVKSRADRPRGTVAALAAGVGAGVILGGIGLYYHLDSRDASNELNAHKATGETWTAEREDTFDRAHSSATRAGVFYGIGGAVLVGTAIALILTEPKEETTVIHPHASTPVVAPTHGGAIVGGMWSF